MYVFLCIEARVLGFKCEVFSVNVGVCARVIGEVVLGCEIGCVGMNVRCVGHA